MIAALRRPLRRYGAIAALVPKLFLAYRAWVWMNLFVQLLAMVIFVYFWRAVYAGRQEITGLTLSETLNYILLAQLVLPTVQHSLIGMMGRLHINGQFAIEMLRPLNFRGMFYVRELAWMAVGFIERLPLLLFAVILFGLELPTDPRRWGAFAVALLLGHALLFCFDWLFACLAFYTTEVWGLAVARYGVSSFFSGALVPLEMMPEWLRSLTEAMPFAQALYVPVSLLSGIAPLADAPRLWLTQAAWLALFYLASALFFRVAVRKVTVQGG